MEAENPDPSNQEHEKIPTYAKASDLLEDDPDESPEVSTSPE